MNARPNDEFDGIFDDLTPQDFTLPATATFPAESGDFDEFVAARLDMTRLAYRPGKSLSPAVLSNGHEVRQIKPLPGEVMENFLQRLSLHAQDMHAHSFYFAKIVDAGIVVQDKGFGVLWIAHHLADGEQIVRSGLIAIENRTLSEDDDATTFEASALHGSAIGIALIHVLTP